MKKFAPAFAILLFILPSVSSAAALTQQQANSLIAVVQSSPGTPASVFISLITAFSSITTTQASSLITVVQAAPGVPANAFVNLLTSFTVDTPTTQSTDTVLNTPTSSVDICKNIEGMQTDLPTGMHWDNNQNCVASEQNVQPVPVVDLCNNIEGAQSHTPSDMTRDADGNCIVPPAPTQTSTITPNAATIKATDIGNKITAYLQTLNAQIAALNVKIAIEKSQVTPPKTSTCQKTSAGCVLIPTQPSYNVSISVDTQTLSQLTQRKNTLNTIYTEVQNYGNGGAMPSADHIAFLASSPMEISW